MRRIDADALIEKCGEWYVEEGPEDGFIGTIKQLIDTQPSVQPERKTGRWILVASGRGGYECSCCHEYAPSYRCGEDRLSNFWPNCGAKMERGEEE